MSKIEYFELQLSQKLFACNRLVYYDCLKISIKIALIYKIANTQPRNRQSLGPFDNFYEYNSFSTHFLN